MLDRITENAVEVSDDDGEEYVEDVVRDFIPVPDDELEEPNVRCDLFSLICPLTLFCFIDAR